MSDKRKRVEGFCDQAGMEKDSPLRLALLTVMETAETAQEAVKGGARGLTPEGEAELIRRVTDAVAETTEREAERVIRRFDLQMGLRMAMGMLLLLGSGYSLGQANADPVPAASIESGAFMAQLAEMNNLRAIRDHCLKHTVPQNGGTACELPMVWLKRPIQ
ncbi:hypothetical protein SAE02_67430 [Skermanella aerolata]|uniref:Uncharacterized protein n=1 Tax=Skermanella aerolata TaxID=393310 RepID=A0A512E1I9_9PROT|nr:hypothetical protein [Skermanella aerolata]GEO42595.1 hypothetical protein SAE02_67430 [Skermanella aerolata]